MFVHEGVEFVVAACANGTKTPEFVVDTADLTCYRCRKIVELSNRQLMFRAFIPDVTSVHAFVGQPPVHFRGRKPIDYNSLILPTGLSSSTSP